MSVSSANPVAGPFTGNGVTTSFPFTFKALSPNEVGVLLRSSSDDVVLTSGVSVTLTDGGGTAVVTPPPPTGVQVLVFSDPSFNQDIQFEDGSRWLAGPVNEANDRAAVRDLVLRDRIGRSITAPIGEAAFPELPAAAARAGKVLAFDPVTGALTVEEAPTGPPGPVGPANTAAERAIRLAANRMVAGVDFALPADSSTPAHAAINLGLIQLGDRGGGVLDLAGYPFLTVGATILINRPRVSMVGSGRDTFHDAGTPTFGTTIIPTFAGAPVLLHQSPYNGGAKITGGGFRDMRVIGNDIATELLRIDSVDYCDTDLALEACVGNFAAVLTASRTGIDLGERADLQRGRVRLTVRQIDTGPMVAAIRACGGVKLTGSTSANVSKNELVFDVQHYDGTALLIENADNNFIEFRGIRLAGGTGYGVYCLGIKPASPFGATSNTFTCLETNAFCYAEGTDTPGVTAPVFNSILHGLDNFSVQPAAGAGSGWRIWNGQYGFGTGWDTTDIVVRNRLQMPAGFSAAINAQSPAANIHCVFGVPDNAPGIYQMVVSNGAEFVPIGATPVDGIGAFTQAGSFHLPSFTTTVQTTGYRPGITGRATYSYSNLIDAAYVTAHPRTSFLSANGRGFRMDVSSGPLRPAQVGAYGLTDAGTLAPDDTQYLQTLIDELHARGETGPGVTGGGVLRLDGTRSYFINSRLNVGKWITIEGAYQRDELVDHDPAFGSAANQDKFNTTLGALPGTLILGSNGQIVLNDGSGLKNVLVISAPLANFRNQISPALTAADIQTLLTAYSGYPLAIATVNGASGVFVKDSMVAGFQLGIKFVYNERFEVTNVRLDCINGILASQIYDYPRLRNIHCWPFGWAHRLPDGTPGAADLLSNYGTAIKFDTGIDLTRSIDGAIVDGFAIYGYKIGIDMVSANGVLITGGWIDNEQQRADITSTIGIRTSGNQTRNKIIGVHVDSCGLAYDLQGVGPIQLESNTSAGLSAGHMRWGAGTSIQIGSHLFQGGFAQFIEVAAGVGRVTCSSLFFEGPNYPAIGYAGGGLPSAPDRAMIRLGQVTIDNPGSGWSYDQTQWNHL